MEMTLQRLPSSDLGTNGDLYVGDDWHSYTYEDIVREVKIMHETAIPAGRYRITFENSKRFGPDTLTVNNVPGFSDIRIHGGNTAENTSGCPLVGLERTATGIRNCKPALDSLKAKVQAAMQGGETVWLEILDAA